MNNFFGRVPSVYTPVKIYGPSVEQRRKIGPLQRNSDENLNTVGAVRKGVSTVLFSDF